MHLRHIAISATAAAATGSAGAAVTGDSLVIENAVRAKGVRMLAFWNHFNTNGFMSQFSTPSMHDTTRGVRSVTPLATVSKPMLMPNLPLEPQETMSVTLFAAATAGDVELLHVTIWYGDLPGVSARLRGADVVKDIETIVTIETQITGGAGVFGAEEALTAESDLLKGNRDYAVLGVTCLSQVHSGVLAIRGPDTGNVRVGMPLIQDATLGAAWFLSLTSLGVPTVPIISSGNKNSTYLSICGNENAASMRNTLFLGLLKK